MDALFFAILTVFSLAIGIIFAIKRLGFANIIVFLILFMVAILFLQDNTIDYTYSAYNTVTNSIVTTTVRFQQPLFPLLPLIIFLLAILVIIKEIEL